MLIKVGAPAPTGGYPCHVPSIADSDDPPLGPQQTYQRIPVDEIDVPNVRVRREFEGIDDLAQSLNTLGLLLPIHVYVARGRYRLIAGERRLRAARLLNWTEIDAFIRQPSDDDLMIELVENTQRRWLTDTEEADAFIRLVREGGRDSRSVAEQAGRSEAYVSKRIRVFEDPLLRSAVERNSVPVSAAEEFLALPIGHRSELLGQAIEEAWDRATIREAVRRVLTQLRAPPAPTADTSSGDADTEASPTSERAPRGPADPGLISQVRALTRALRDVRPYQLTAAHERALGDLMQALLRLARAHAAAPAGQSGPVFPALEEAERATRRR